MIYRKPEKTYILELYSLYRMGESTRCENYAARICPTSDKNFLTTFSFVSPIYF